MESPAAVLFLSLLFRVWAAMDSCYDAKGNPGRCMPEFENAAFNRTVVASNTCGQPAEDYCMQASSSRSCHRCDAADPLGHHGATYLTDFHVDEEPTWWQSQSMFYGVQHPQSVNLTLHLGKAFEITYIRLKFHTSRPESFAIYRRSTEGGPWLPYQYYSASCHRTYGKDSRAFLRPGDEERTALCTDEFSDISPLTGGNVAFSTLEGRPSAYNFDQSPVLQDWVTATDLLISLDRLNTFGDEFFKDASVLRSYYYAISDFSVGGRCKCNGHASQCVPGHSQELVCACQHHTAGVDCQECQPFYQDRPWARATADSANECILCNCSDRANTCEFDGELYRSTGRGGRCMGCRDNTDGPHCERCREGFHRSSPQDACVPCDCNPLGSLSLQCTHDGRCLCRHTVAGEKCDACQPGFHTLRATGCRECNCYLSGSLGLCSPLDGQCHCKAHVEGHACDRCKPGFFNLDALNPRGCESCFCFGHSAVCTSASQYSAISIISDFLTDPDGWTGEFSGGQESHLIWKEGEVYLLPYTDDDVGFYKAPQKFLGNHLLSYGQLLSLSFVAETPELLPQRVTVVLEGSGMSVSAELLPEARSLHTDVPEHTFNLRLHAEEGELRQTWSSVQLRSLLYNLTSVKISNAGGLNYTSQLSRVSLSSAQPSANSSPSAAWVEECSCPLGFVGQFCERCTPGYKRDTPNGGPFARCVPCACNRHGDCHPETGVCQCRDFTTGPACERCLDGYYGNALKGSPDDCQPCPCPGQSSCAQVPETGELVCTNCPPGHRGTRCEICDDGFYGDPLGLHSAAQPCTPCDCHGNTDSNAVGVCEHLSGRCLKCLHHTDGDHCERCRRGYYGNALDPHSADKCKSCSCNPNGSASSPENCHPSTGQCLCLDHVTGRDCSRCEAGHYDMRPGLGCRRCMCNPIGSPSAECHPITGQCVCRPGVEGLSCDSCRAGFFGLSVRGCRACNCDPMGSVTMQCYGNGTCACRQGFTGYKCDMCQVNYFHDRATHQCQQCPVCYGLVRDQVEKLKERLQDLERLLSRYDCRKWHSLQYRPQQGDDPLPNMLMDLLAVQDAKDAFVRQFTQLEAEVQALELHLHGVGAEANCSLSKEEEGPSRQCGPLSDSAASVSRALVHLRQASATLVSMVIPFGVTKEPNQWAVLVNESQALAQSHEEIANHIQSVAKKALTTSNHTYNLLTTLLEDDSMEQFIHNLTQQLVEMQEAKENLTVQVNETMAKVSNTSSVILAQTAEMANITASTQQLLSDLQQEEVDLGNKTQELELLVQAKDKLVSKISDEMGPRVRSVEKHLETIQEYDQLTARAEEAKLSTTSAVVRGKETDSEATALLKHLHAIQKAWPRTVVHTHTYLTRDPSAEQDVLADARKSTALADGELRPALGSATQSNGTATDAAGAANAALKEAKDSLVQAKRTRSASKQLSSSVDTVLQQLQEQEQRAAQTHAARSPEDEDSVKDVRMTIEAAKLQLETYTLMLSKLLNEIEGNNAVHKFDFILNKTATRLGILQHSMESPALGMKMRALYEASRDQEAQLRQVDLSIGEIAEERRSLEDIALHLPRTCPDRSKVGRP